MKRLAALLVVVAVGVVLAGLFLPSPAATVGGSAISRQSLDSDLSAIASSPDYTCFLGEERQLSGRGTLPFLGAGTASTKGGVYDTTFVDDWLDSMITDRVAAEVVQRRGIQVTASDVSVGHAVLGRRISEVLDQFASDTGGAAAGCGGSGSAVLASLPSWFVTEQSRNEADQAVLDARAAGTGLSSGAVDGYFQSHRTTFARDCLDVIVVKSRKTAEAVEAALAGGATFAHEASAESLTQSSAARGGAAGCGVLAGSFFSPAVSKLRVGQTSAPLSGEGAYWVVQLTSRTPPSFSSVRTTVVTSIIDAGQQRANTQLTSALRRSSITVDPRYGSAASRKVTLVAPPTSPPVATVLSPSAAQPAVTSASA
jgi:hypothetical protein